MTISPLMQCIASLVSMSVKFPYTRLVTEHFLKQLREDFPFLEEWNLDIDRKDIYFRGIRLVNPLVEPAVGITKYRKIYLCNPETKEMHLHQLTDENTKLWQLSDTKQKGIQVFANILPRDKVEQYKFILTSEIGVIDGNKGTIYTLWKLIPVKEIMDEVAEEEKRKAREFKTFFEE